MRLLTLNIGSIESRWDERAVEVAAWINLTAPEVIALQEVSCADEHRTSLDDISRFLDHNSYFCHFAGHPMNSGRGAFGVAIMSRLPPDDVGQIDLPTDPTAVAARTVAWIEFGTTRIYSAHLAPDLHNTEHRLAQIDVLKAAILAQDETTTVLCGDLNCEINSTAMRRLLSPLGDMASWIDDLWSLTNPRIPGYTWDCTTNPLAHDRNGSRRRLDYVLAPRRLARGASMSVVCAKRMAGPVFASDHFGLLAQLPELRQ